MPQPVQLLLARDMASSAARILEILLTCQNLSDAVRFWSIRRPHMHREDKTASTRVIVKDDFNGRVREDASIPVKLLVDTDGGKRRRQRPRGHNMSDRQWHVAAIEITHLRCLDVRRPDRQPWSACVQPHGIDQFFKRAL